MGPQQPRTRRSWLAQAGVRAAAALVAVTLVVELLAAWNVRWMRAAREREGGLLFTESDGAGQPVVLIAGFTGSTRFWAPLVPALSTEGRVVRVDALGFGRSPWPSAHYSLDDHLSALRRTLEAEDAAVPVVLVGHSFGAVLASHYAARWPGGVEHLVLIGAPVFESAEDGRRRVRELSPMAALFSFTPLLARESCQLACAFRPLARRLAVLARPGLPEAAAEDGVLHDWQSFDGTMRNVVLGAPLASPLRTLATRSHLPITFLHGTRDRVTTFQRSGG